MTLHLFTYFDRLFIIFSLAIGTLHSEPQICTEEIEERTDCSGKDLNSTILSVNSDEGKKIKSINFSNNNIKHVQGLNRFPHLIDLDLSLNLIQNITGAFSTLEKLEILDLSYNDLQQIKPDVFMKNAHLRNLNLQGNLLRVTSDNPIICSTSLRVLNIGTCALSAITVENFMCLPFLTELDLSSNAITSLTPSVFSSLNHLQIINLRVNRFHCDCKLPELVRWAKSKKTDLSSPEPVYCVLSKNRGRREFNKIEKDLNCTSQSMPEFVSTLKPKSENLSSKFDDFILVSYDTSVQPADSHFSVSFMGFISSKLYTVEALLSLVLLLLVLVTGMLFCRHYRTVGEMSCTLSEYPVYEQISSNKIPDHYSAKCPTIIRM